MAVEFGQRPCGHPAASLPPSLSESVPPFDPASTPPPEPEPAPLVELEPLPDPEALPLPDPEAPDPEPLPPPDPEAVDPEALPLPDPELPPGVESDPPSSVRFVQSPIPSTAEHPPLKQTPRMHAPPTDAHPLRARGLVWAIRISIPVTSAAGRPDLGNRRRRRQRGRRTRTRAPSPAPRGPSLCMTRERRRKALHRRARR